MHYQLLVYLDSMGGPLLEEFITQSPFMPFAVGHFYEIREIPHLFKVFGIHRQILNTEEGVFDRTAIILTRYQVAPSLKRGQNPGQEKAPP